MVYVFFYWLLHSFRVLIICKHYDSPHVNISVSRQLLVDCEQMSTLPKYLSVDHNCKIPHSCLRSSSLTKRKKERIEH